MELILSIKNLNFQKMEKATIKKMVHNHISLGMEKLLCHKFLMHKHQYY